LRFLREQDVDFEPEEGLLSQWRESLLRADRYAIDARLLAARGRLGAWYRVADELTHLLREIGESWQRGKLSIAQEHVASEALSRALARMGDALPTGGIAKKALLACTPGDEHTLGLSLAELCLKEAGFDCVWLGRNTPMEELLTTVSESTCSAVIVSASVTAGCRETLGQIARRLGHVCQQQGSRLFLGGGGDWPEVPAVGRRVRSFDDFNQALKKEFES
jgi:methanogenic corrinoid protein MtbC1